MNTLKSTLSILNKIAQEKYADNKLSASFMLHLNTLILDVILEEAKGDTPNVSPDGR
jgi:hypothetical protein